MVLPELKNYRQKTQKQIIQFGGIDFTDAPAEGKLLNSEGLSSARFPVLAQRGGRSETGSYTSPTAIFAWDGNLCVVDGTDFYYNGVKAGVVQSGEKQFAVVNTKLCIWPDKKYLDISDPENAEWGYLSSLVQAVAGTVVFTTSALTFRTFTEYGEVGSNTGRYWTSMEEACIVIYSSVTWNTETSSWSYSGRQVVKASDANVGDYIIPIYSDSAYSMEAIWSSSSGSLPDISRFSAPNTTGVYGIIRVANTWGEEESEITITEIICTLYDGSIGYDDLTDYFNAGDAVTISGCTTYAANNKVAIIKSVSSQTITFDSGTFSAGNEAASITVERFIPDMDFVCEWNNRLWGVSNATENEIYDSETDTTKTVYSRAIYGSSLGDPTNFNVFEGLSTDSYAVAVASEGDFTGIVSYSNSLLCWKENRLHKLVGSVPSDYYLYSYNFTGLQAESHKSLEIINEVLFFKGRDGIYAYTGDVPELISYIFGINRFSKAIAGTDGSRYYVSMLDSSSLWNLFVYDPLHGAWMREDDTHATDFTCLGGNLYFLSGTKIYIAEQIGSTETVEWLAEFTPFTETVHQRKCYSRLYLRLEMDSGAWVKAEVKCDNGPWKAAMTLANAQKKTVTIPIRPNRCDSFVVRLSGKGNCVVSSMVREFQYGSEV